MIELFKINLLAFFYYGKIKIITDNKLQITGSCQEI